MRAEPTARRINTTRNPADHTAAMEGHRPNADPEGARGAGAEADAEAELEDAAAALPVCTRVLEPAAFARVEALAVATTAGAACAGLVGNSGHSQRGARNVTTGKASEAAIATVQTRCRAAAELRRRQNDKRAAVANSSETRTTRSSTIGVVVAMA
jgi:hypothetical protein